MKLSIVIVNWNSKEYVRKCLESIRCHCSDMNLQIIVVDGGSFDGCGEMLAQCYPEATFVQSPCNIGFGRCNNLGVESATGEALLLLNPDTEVEPGALQTMLAALETLPKAGIIGPRLLNSDGTRQEGSVHAFPNPLNQALGSEFLRQRFPQSSLWKTHEAAQSKEPIRVEAVGGACMLMWTKTFREAGGFTHHYFMYAEDMDLCLKIHRRGYRNYHHPRARVFHHAGCSSSRQFSKFAAVLQPLSLHIYMRLNYGRATAALYRLFMFVSAALRTLLLVLAWMVRPAVRKRIGNSLKRWAAVLSWSLGGQCWTKPYRLNLQPIAHNSARPPDLVLPGREL